MTGTQSRFQAKLEEHWKIVLNVANTYCRNPEDRRDLAQEISLQLWRAFPAYREDRAFSTWMYRIALNVAISQDRARRTRSRFSAPLADADSVIDTGANAMETDERVRDLYRVIDEMGAPDRALLMLYLEEHSYEQIAEILGLTETNVATKINRLKQKIRKEFTAEEVK